MSEPQKGTQKPTTETFHVVGPGSVTRGKTQVKAGQSLELTADEAKELGELVANGAAPAPKLDVSKRQDGKYRIVGPGTVWCGGSERQIGEVIELSTQDARLLGETVEQA